MGKKKSRRSSLIRYHVGKAANRITGGGLTRHISARSARIVERELLVSNWPKSLDGLRIAHLSDFHLGELLRFDQAIEVLNALREHPVDLVAVTGDIIDFHCDGVEPLLKELVEFPSRLGTWAVLGNHDRLVNVRRFLRLCRNSGLRMLINERIHIDVDGQPLALAGIDWARRPTDLAALVEKVCRPQPEAPQILLAHHPAAFDAAAEAGVDVVLSGHTHGGQLNLVPARGEKPPVGLSSFHRYAWGVYTNDSSVLHVTSGIGSWFPFRVRCPSEAAVLTIRHHGDESSPRG